MKNIFGNNAKHIVAFLLLGFFAFSFLHSELGLFDCRTDNHGTHDYCELVKVSNAISSVSRDELPKLELKKDICLHCFEVTKAQNIQTCFNKTDQPRLVKQSANIYLFNRTFLI